MIIRGLRRNLSWSSSVIRCVYRRSYAYMDMVKTPSPLPMVNGSRNGSNSPPSQHTSESDPDTPVSSEPNTPCSPNVDFALHQFERSAKILQLSDWFLRSKFHLFPSSQMHNWPLFWQKWYCYCNFLCLPYTCSTE